MNSLFLISAFDRILLKIQNSANKNKALLLCHGHSFLTREATETMSNEDYTDILICC